MADILNFERPTLTATDYALKYAALGWHVFPCWWINDQGACACGSDTCKNPGKHPIGSIVPGGQNMATTDAETIKRWWGRFPRANVAASMVKSGLVGIDIDPRNGGLYTIEAVEAKHGKLESDVLQFTGGGGEHRVFMLASSGVNLPGKLGDGVDVKLNGYLMLEPSNHVSGKQYAWEGSSNPLDGAVPSPLPDWLRNMAQAVQKVDAGQSERFVTAEQVAELRDALGYIPSDDRDTWVRFGMALRSIGQEGFDLWDEWSRKSHKYDPVDSARTWRSFKPGGAVNFESIFFEAQRLGWLNPLSGSGKQAEPEIVVMLNEPMPVKSVDVEDDFAQIPEHLLNFGQDSIISRIVEFSLSTAPMPSREMSAFGALSIVGTLCGRKIQTASGLRTNNQIIVVAGSGQGKDHPRKVNKAILVQAGLQDLLGGEEVASGQGLMTAMSLRPNSIFQQDEFGMMLQCVANPKAGSHQIAILSAFMKLYSSAASIMAGTERADQKNHKRIDIEYPCCNLFGTTTPEELFPAMSSAQVVNGYANRMLFMFVPSKRARRNNAAYLGNVDADIIEWAQTMRAYSIGMEGVSPANPVKLGMSGSAARIFNELDERVHASMDSDDEIRQKMVVRQWEHSQKVAAVIAASRMTVDAMRAGVRPVIDERDARHAVDLVQWITDQTLRVIESRVSDSEFEGQCKEVLRVIQGGRDEGRTERQISDYSRKFRAIDPISRDRILNSLKREDRIFLVTFKPSSGRGKSRNAWVASEYINDE